MLEISTQHLEEALHLLDARLGRNSAPPVGIVVCGGAALIALNLLTRTTSDVDIVALADSDRNLLSPAPLPSYLLAAAREVEQALDLPRDWLNNGPSSDRGGLFQLGLPEGLAGRLHERRYGEYLTAYFVSRVDQIHFKLYASVDRGGYHISDLMALKPEPRELSAAARWAVTHDVSEGFRGSLKQMLEALGYESVAEEL